MSPKEKHSDHKFLTSEVYASIGTENRERDSAILSICPATIAD